MCCLLVATKLPTLEVLEKIGMCNRDGFGVGYYNNKGKCQYIKGIKTAKEVFELVKEINIFPIAIHARLSSQGGKSELLTHPFEISPKSQLRLEGECNKLLFHNGHVGLFEDKAIIADVDLPKNEPLSDTRAIAMICSKHRDNGARFLHSLNNKFVVMDAKIGKFRLIPFEGFVKEDGIYYSNTFWKFRCNTNSHTYASYHGNDYEWEGRSHYPIANQKKDEKGFIDLGYFAKLTKKAKRKLFKRLGITENPNNKSESETNPLESDDIELCTFCNHYMSEQRITQLDNMGCKEADRMCWECEKNFYKKEEETPTKIHEQSQANFQLPLDKKYIKMSDNTKKILGIPLEQKQQQMGDTEL